MKYIKSINIETLEEKYFKSKRMASRYHGCSPALVYNIVEHKGTNMFNKIIKFAYINDDILINEFTHVADPRIGRSKYANEEEKQEAMRQKRINRESKQIKIELPKKIKKTDEEKKIIIAINAKKRYQLKKEMKLSLKTNDTML